MKTRNKTIVGIAIFSAGLALAGCGGPQQQAIDAVRLGQSRPADLQADTAAFGWTTLHSSDPLPAASQVTLQRALTDSSGQVVAVETLKLNRAHRGFWKSDGAEYSLEFTVEPGGMVAPPVGWSLPSSAGNIDQRSGMAILPTRNPRGDTSRSLDQVRRDVEAAAPGENLAAQALRIRAMLAELPPVDRPSAQARAQLKPIATLLTRGPSQLLGANRQAIATALGQGEWEGDYENMEWRIEKIGPSSIRIAWETGNTDAAFFGLEPN